MKTHYIAPIHKEADSGYGVSFPDVPGVTTVADTMDEALLDAGVALGFAFEDWQGSLPAHHTLDQLRADGAFREWATDALVTAAIPTHTIADAE